MRCGSDRGRVSRRAWLPLVVGALLLVAWPRPAAAGSTPTLNVAPSIIAPSRSGTLTASGFAPGESVGVSLDSTVVAVATAGSTGSISLPLTIPASETPGNHWVTALGRLDGVQAQELITVHTGWAQHGWDATGDSVNLYENVLNPFNVERLMAGWTQSYGPVEGGFAVAVGARQVIVGSPSGIVRTVSQMTGATVWTQTLGGPVRSTPARVNVRVYFDAGDGFLYALDARTGAILWRTWLGARGNLSSPTPADNGHVVYVGSADGNLYALDAVTGAVLWKGITGGAIYSSPAVGRYIVVGSNDGSIYAFADGCATGGATCAPVWQTKIGVTGKSSPAVSNGVVYVGASNNLYALDSGTGQVLWAGPLGGSSSSNSPAVDKGVVYIARAKPSGVLEAFAAGRACSVVGPNPCAPLWSSATVGGTVSSNPAIANGVVYISGYTSQPASSTVMAFAETPTCVSPCAPLWTGTRSGGTDPNPPIVSDGMLITGFETANLASGGLTAWTIG